MVAENEFFGTKPTEKMHESAESDQQPTRCFTGKKINHNRPEESQTSELG